MVQEATGHHARLGLPRTIYTNTHTHTHTHIHTNKSKSVVRASPAAFGRQKMPEETGNFCNLARKMQWLEDVGSLVCVKF